MENNHYRTSNTPLAAYLQTEGYALVDVITSPHRFYPNEIEAVFLFENNKDINDFARRWATGKAEGDLNLFYHIYRTTVHKAKMAVKVALSPDYKPVNGAGGELRETHTYKCKSSAQAAPPAPTSDGGPSPLTG